MNTIRQIEKINREELDRGIAGTLASWHSQFANCPWCYVGNIDHGLSEGDVMQVVAIRMKIRVSLFLRFRTSDDYVLEINIRERPF